MTKKKRETFFTVGHKTTSNVPVAIYYTNGDIPVGLRTADKPQFSDYVLDTEKIVSKLSGLQYGPTVRKDILIDMLQATPGNVVSIAFNENNLVLVVDTNPGAPDPGVEWTGENVAILSPMHPGLNPAGVDKIIKERLE